MSGDPHTPEAAAQSARQEAADDAVFEELDDLLHGDGELVSAVLADALDQAVVNAGSVGDDTTLTTADAAQILSDNLLSWLRARRGE